MTPNDPIQPHPFELCTLEHLFEREPHCSVCDEPAAHELHDVTELPEEGWPV